MTNLRFPTGFRLSIRQSSIVNCKSIFTAFLFVFILLAPAQSALRYDEARSLVIDTALDEAEIFAALESEHAAVRKAGLYRLRELGDSSLEEHAWPLLSDPAWSVRRMAFYALENCATAKSRAPVEAALEVETHPEVMSRAIYVLGRIADSRSAPILLSYLENASFLLRGVAAEQMRYVGDTSRLSILENMSRRDSVGYVRLRAGGTVEAWGGRAVTEEVEESTTRRFPRRYRWILAGLLLTFVPPPFLFFIALLRRSRVESSVRLAGFSLLWFISGMVVLFCAGLGFSNDATELSVTEDFFAQGLGGRWTERDRFLTDLETVLKSRGFPRALVFSPMTESLAPLRDSLRQQVNAEKTLAFLRERLDSSFAKGMILLTWEDLYSEPYYQCMGYGAKNVTVISARRVDPVFLAEGDGDEADKKIFFERFSKLAVHEIGHLFELDHCREKGCVMNELVVVEDFFRVTDKFCAKCQSRLSKSSIGHRKS